MANPGRRNKCADASAAMRAGPIDHVPGKGHQAALSARGGVVTAPRSLLHGRRLPAGQGSPNSRLLLGLRLFDACGAEFLALLAMQSLFVGLLGAIERFRAARPLGL